jgi:selenocysteine lyase/cysteine desulfurase
LNALADYRDLWDAQPGWLNTASYGLPPRPAWDALQEALTQWRHGSTSWAPWDASTGRARRAFARLVHADPDAIAVGSTVSGMLSVVAAGLPTGSRVLVPEIEFTSNLFPWLVQADRGVEPGPCLVSPVHLRAGRPSRRGRVARRATAAIGSARAPRV